MSSSLASDCSDSPATSQSLNWNVLMVCEGHIHDMKDQAVAREVGINILRQNITDLKSMDPNAERWMRRLDLPFVKL